MYKRSEPSTRDHTEYSNYAHKPDFSQRKTQSKSSGEDQGSDNIQKFIKDSHFISLLNRRGIKKLFPIQFKTFTSIYEGYDLIARDRTGSGKTLAFSLPILQRFRLLPFEHKYPKFLIILPTRELAIQVFNQIESLKYLKDDFKALCVYGKSSIADNVQKLQAGVDILVATPGRLNDLVERGQVSFQSLQVICLDQADQILKQGFKEEIQKVFQKVRQVNTKKMQVLLFSATIPEWLRQLSSEYQTPNTVYINLINNTQIRTSKTIKHLSMDISRFDSQKVPSIIEQMIEKYGGAQKRILIFCERKAQVNVLSQKLRIRNQPLHGDIVQSRRQRAYNDFKSGKLRCIVATNVAARGLDFPSVDLVVQMEPPKSTQDYIHRAGRTGRAGKEGTCLIFFNRAQSRLVSKIESQAKIKIQQVQPNISENSSSGNDRNDRDRSSHGYSRDDNGYSRNNNGYSRNGNGDPRDNYPRNVNNYNRHNNDRNDNGYSRNENGYSRGSNSRENNSKDQLSGYFARKSQNARSDLAPRDYQNKNLSNDSFNREFPKKQLIASRQRRSSPQRKFSPDRNQKRAESPKEEQAKQKKKISSQNDDCEY